MSNKNPKNNKNRTCGTAGKVDMKALEARISQVPEIDTARVVAVHTRISNGEYETPGHRLADRIMDFEQLLGQGKSTRRKD